MNIENILESFYDSLFKNCHAHTLNIFVLIYYIETFIEISFNFKQSLMNSYVNDFYWSKILTVVKSEFEDFFKLWFMFKDDFFYYCAINKMDRFCISKILIKQIFKQIHNQKHHDGIQWIFDRLINVYIRHVIKHVKTYIKHCFICNFNHTKRHRPYGELRFFNTSDILFHIISMDFIINMFIAEKFDIFLIITDKLSKRILLILDINIYKMFEWVNVIFEQFMFHDWKLFTSIVSNRDSKFLSSFWRVVWTKLNTDLLTVSAYHQQANGQAEWMNQFVEIVFRYYLAIYFKDLHSWHKILFYIQTKLNNVKHAETGFAPNELIYDFKIWDFLDFLWNLSFENYFKTRQYIHNKIEQVLIFVNAYAKKCFDNRHKLLKNVKINNQMYFQLHHEYKFLNQKSKNFLQQRVGPFRVLKTLNGGLIRVAATQIFPFE